MAARSEKITSEASPNHSFRDGRLFYGKFQVMTKQLKIALGVGAGDAIGAAFARRFAAGGYAIAIARRDASKSAVIVTEIEAAGGRMIAYDVDARDETSVFKTRNNTP